MFIFFIFVGVFWGGSLILFSRRRRPYFLFSGGGGAVCVVFFWARNTTLFSKEWANMLHPFQGNLHKGMLHCPQEIPWSLEAQLLIEEYPFKTMLYFLQGILYLFKWQFHALRFLTETSPFLKGIVVYNCIYIYERVPFCTRT